MKTNELAQMRQNDAEQKNAPKPYGTEERTVHVAAEDFFCRIREKEIRDD